MSSFLFIIGENVKNFFFRLSSLLFNKSIIDEYKTEPEKKQLGGNDVILNTGKIKFKKLILRLQILLKLFKKQIFRRCQEKQSLQ
jgi:hypothetical protein